MRAEEFEQIWLDQVQIEKSMLLERASSYASEGDRLANFYAGSELSGVSPLQYGFILNVKHIIALRDLITKISCGNAEFTEKEEARLLEYVTDIRNYMVLLKAIYKEIKLQQWNKNTSTTLVVH